MSKILVDANVLLRYLLRDDEEMATAAKQVINAGVYTLPEVVAEVIYVLRKVYHADKEDVSQALDTILEDINFDNPELIRMAIQNYQVTSLDFVDCILAAYQRTENVKVFTFDKKLANFCNK